MKFTERCGCHCAAKVKKHDHFYIDGEEVSKRRYDAALAKHKREGYPGVLHETSGAWPRKSNSIAVHSSQVQEAQEMCAKMGVPTEFDKKTGKAIFRSNAHQRDFLKATGNANWDAGYGGITG